MSDLDLNQELELELDDNIAQPAEEQKETLKLPASDQPANVKPKDIFDIDKMTPEQKAQEALRLGHIPKEDFRGDISRWKDPDSFLKETYEKLPALRNVIKQNREMMDVQNMLLKSKVEEVKRLHRELESAKINNQRKIRESLDNGDLNEYHNLQEQSKTLDADLEDTRTRSAELEKVASRIEVENSPENKAVAIEDQIATKTWLDQNPHYKVNYEEINTTEELNFRKEADKYFRHYKQNYPEAPLHQIYRAVDSQLQKSGLKKQAANTYNYAPANNNPAPKSRDYTSLSPSAKRACDRFVAGGLDKQSYIDNLDDESFTWHKS